MTRNDGASRPWATLQRSKSTHPSPLLASNNSRIAELHACYLLRHRWARQVTWLPCQETSRGPDSPSSSCSDHLFLLRKGVPVGRISFNVAKTSDDVDKIISIENGNNNSENSSSRRNSIPKIGVGRGYDASIPAVFKAKVRIREWNILRKLDLFVQQCCSVSQIDPTATIRAQCSECQIRFRGRMVCRNFSLHRVVQIDTTIPTEVTFTLLWEVDRT